MLLFSTKTKRIWLALFALLLIICFLIFLVLASQRSKTVPKSVSTNQNQVQSKTQNLLKGVSLSPKSFSGSDFSDFFSVAKQAGEVITWSGNWKELGDKNAAPSVLVKLSRQFNFKPIILASSQTDISSGKGDVEVLDEKTKTLYRSVAVDFVKEYKPEYIAFGVEVNRIYEQFPTRFEDFSVIFAQVYVAVKAVSPGTKVFTIFQLERLKGLRGGLFGGTNDLTKTDWALIDKFPKADLIAFTTYPGLIYKDPSEIPDDYYTEIKLHTSKPVAFTEVGWASDASIKGWESSETEQAQFVSRFFELTKPLNPQIRIWSFLYDQKIEQPFTSTGLFDSTGKPRQAWETWKKVPD